MPHNVRNFWIEAEVDGRKTPIKFGPRGKDEGFRLTVYMRNEGAVEAVICVEGVNREGELILSLDCDYPSSGSIDGIRGGWVRFCRQR